jgi:hypothetical protein
MAGSYSGQPAFTPLNATVTHASKNSLKKMSSHPKKPNEPEKNSNLVPDADLP